MKHCKQEKVHNAVHVKRIKSRSEQADWNRQRLLDSEEPVGCDIMEIKHLLTETAIKYHLRR